MDSQKLKFLVVDDDTVTTSILSKMLNNGKREIYIASNGDEGLEFFHEVAPDIVFSDVNMPGMSGLEMVEAIRKVNTEVKIAIFTNFDNKEYMLQAIRLGVNQFFAKPFDRAHFLQIVEHLSNEILSKRSVEQALNRHRNILHAINTMASQLLQYRKIEETLYEQMRLIKEAAEASALFIFKNDQGNNPRFARRFLQLNDNSDATPPPLLPYAQFEKEDWLSRLKSGISVNELVSAHDAHDVPIFYEHRINSLLILPIYSAERWWGILGIGNNDSRVFDATDTSTLKTVAQMVGSALAAQYSISQLEMRSAVFKSTVDGIIITDAENKIIQCNEAFEDMTGFTIDEVVGEDPAVLGSGNHDEHFFHEMWRSLEHEGHWDGEVHNRKKNGQVYEAWVRISVIRKTNGKVKNYIGIFSDFTLRNKNEQMYRKMATHDALTGLSNRLILDDRLSQALLHAEHSGSSVALFFIDLDNFKPINDTYGHRVGDVILQRCAEHFRNSVRAEDTICRYGGDEFVMIFEDVEDFTVLDILANKIMSITKAPVIIEGVELAIHMSIGITVFPIDAKNSEDLLRCADEAMYLAKRRGKNRVAFYGESH